MRLFALLLLGFYTLKLGADMPLDKKPTNKPYSQVISQSPELRKLVLAAADKIYNFQFQEGEKLATTILIKCPAGHPVYDILMGISKVWQWEPVMNNKQLKTEAIHHFENAAKKAVSFMQTQKKEDLDAMFIHFSANGFLARIYSFSGEFLKAVQYANKAYDYVRKGKTLKEMYPDFYFSTGMYNFYRESFPEHYPAVKPFMGMLDKGNIQVGIEQLKVAYSQGLFSRIEAANYLANIYLKYQGQPTQVKQFLEDITQSLPGNLFLQVKLGECFFYEQDKDNLLKVCARLFKSDLPYYNMAGFVFMAKKYMLEDRWQDAFDAMVIAKKYYDKVPGIVDNLPGYYHENWAVIYERRKDLSSARSHWMQVVTRSEYPWYQKKAKIRLKTLAG